jgi:tetratricopeptide (TPR) repeat protein
MIRCFAALFALTLIACRGVPRSLDGELTKARELLRKEQFALVLGQVDQWSQLAGDRHDPISQWRFRLVKADALLGQGRSSGEVLKLLTEQGEIPVGAELAADRAQWLMLQARAEYTMGRRREVSALLDRADDAAAHAKRPDLAAEIELRRGFLLRDEGKFPEAHGAYTIAILKHELKIVWAFCCSRNPVTMKRFPNWSEAGGSPVISVRRTRRPARRVTSATVTIDWAITTTRVHRTKPLRKSFRATITRMKFRYGSETPAICTSMRTIIRRRRLRIRGPRRSHTGLERKYGKRDG